MNLGPKPKTCPGRSQGISTQPTKIALVFMLGCKATKLGGGGDFLYILYGCNVLLLLALNRKGKKKKLHLHLDTTTHTLYKYKATLLGIDLLQKKKKNKHTYTKYFHQANKRYNTQCMKHFTNRAICSHETMK